MNILMVTADYPPIEGGISRVSQQLSRKLADMGHHVTVVAPYFPDQEAVDIAGPVKVVRYRGYNLGWPRLFPMLFATWPLVAGTDLVLAMNVAYGGVIGVLAKAAAAKPYVTFGYAYEFLKFRRTPGVSRLLRCAYSHSDVVVAISRFTRDNLAAFGVTPEKIAVVYPGATPPSPQAPEIIRAVRHRFLLDTDHTILAAGRFVRRKGHVTLVQAMPQILERFPDAQLLMVGQGKYLREAVLAANRLGIRDHVIFPGRVSDDELAALYQACEIFALPTGSDASGHVEGFGLVFAEAHAFGKPVVAGRSGGVMEAVVDGETGIIVEPEDPEALAKAIVSLMEDPDLARRLGEAGRIRVETELNWAQFANRLMETVETRLWKRSGSHT